MLHTLAHLGGLVELLLFVDSKRCYTLVLAPYSDFDPDLCPWVEDDTDAGTDDDDGTDVPGCEVFQSALLPPRQGGLLGIAPPRFFHCAPVYAWIDSACSPAANSSLASALTMR